MWLSTRVGCEILGPRVLNTINTITKFISANSEFQEMDPIPGIQVPVPKNKPGTTTTKGIPTTIFFVKKGRNFYFT